MRNRKLRFSGILCVAWIALILLFATQGGDESHSLSYSVTRMLASVLFPDFNSWSVSVQSDWIYGMEELIRKIAHFVEFAVLGMVAFPTVHFFLSAIQRRKPVTALRSGFIAFCLCAVIATASELVQVIVVNRTATSSDVLLDCFGILLGLYFAGRRFERGQRNPENATPTVYRHRKG